MISKRSASLLGLTVIGALALSACAANEPAATTTESSAATEQLSGTLVGAGASSQGSAQESWIAGFQGANPDATVNYDPSGSGAGREAFLQGGVQFAGSDRAFKDDEIAAGGFAACAADSNIIELPLYISPIAVIFNVPGVKSLNLDSATVSNIFLGNITNWNDPAIASQNAGVSLPDLAITPVHRSDDSGTTENFTEYLNATAPDVWTAEPDGVWPISGGEAAQGTTGLVDAVKGGNGTIGYADASRAGDLGTVAVKVGSEYVPFSPEAAAAVIDASPEVEGRTEGDIAIDIDRTVTDAGVYPLVLVSYLIGCETYADAEQAALVKGYFSYIASTEGQETAASEAGSAPISDTLRTQIESAISLIS